MREKSQQIVVLLAVFLTGIGKIQAEELKSNYFNDPFLQVTKAISDCPEPVAPMLTMAQVKAEAHSRIERGTSCYQSGQCRLPNAYLYDKEIVPRVQRAIEADGRFTDSSIWVEGQRRFVWLKGCVRSATVSEELEKLVRNLDDVQGVVNQLLLK
ncbi:BON domain-containing protein [Undibacterium sp. TJN19]|uniref:BON domain-containing protein n=1 Tax=Undibacterium sp. TJN19 TaxID=3413055 RepID=UPI003BEF6BA5